MVAEGIFSNFGYVIYLDIEQTRQMSLRKNPLCPSQLFYEKLFSQYQQRSEVTVRWGTLLLHCLLHLVSLERHGVAIPLFGQV